MTRYTLGSRQGGFTRAQVVPLHQHIHPGNRADRGCTEERSVLFPWFKALLRQQTGANVSAPCSCCEVGAGFTDSWEDETNRRMAQFSHLSLPLPLANQETSNWVLLGELKCFLYGFSSVLEGYYGSTWQNPAVPLTVSSVTSRTKCSQAWTRRCWKSISTVLETMRQTCQQ